MIIDGKKIAKGIYARAREKVQKLSHAPELAIVTCAPNFETQKYLALKKKQAAAIGIVTRIIELPHESTTETFQHAIRALTSAHGIVVQLPLPSGVDTDAVLKSIPITHDVDALNPETTAILSPVVGAFQEILAEANVSAKDKLVAIIGSGRLVGLPAYQWFEGQGAHVSVVTKDTVDIGYYTKNADIVVCGAGVSGLLTPDMVREGVIILDAGTSEDGGVLKGDADPRCAEKARIFTPVPGGIGPITIATLLSNVVDCARERKGVV